MILKVRLGYLHGLQILDDLGLVEGLDAGKHAGLADGGALLGRGELIEFAARVSQTYFIGTKI